MKLKMILPSIMLGLLMAWGVPAQDFDGCFSVIVGREASTDGYVYLAHNEDQGGEQMLNIYNLPAAPGRLASLWFEFPGSATGDIFVNECGVVVTSNHCPSREKYAEGSVLYEVRTAVGHKARSAREGVKIIGEMVEKVCRKAILQGRNGKSVKVRALRPGDPLDKRLLEFLKKLLILFMTLIRELNFRMIILREVTFQTLILNVILRKFEVKHSRNQSL